MGCICPMHYNAARQQDLNLYGSMIRNIMAMLRGIILIWEVKKNASRLSELHFTEMVALIRLEVNTCRHIAFWKITVLSF